MRLHRPRIFSRPDPDAPPEGSTGPRPPEGARVVRADGTIVPCGLLLRGASGGFTHWLAVPMGEINPLDGDRFRVGMMPARSSIELQWANGGGQSAADMIANTFPLRKPRATGVRPLRLLTGAVIVAVMLSGVWERMAARDLALLFSLTWSVFGWILLISGGWLQALSNARRRFRQWREGN